MDEAEALELAKDNVGGATALAQALAEAKGAPITPQAVSQWKKVPPDRVLDVERITGVSRHELRPDVFGQEQVGG